MQRTNIAAHQRTCVQPFLGDERTWDATARPHLGTDFEALLLAIAGHDLRQPLQVLQSAHELLGMGVRTSSELRLLQSGQRAIDRLRDQLGLLTSAIRIREHTKSFKLMPVCAGDVLRQAYRDNEASALSKGVSVRFVTSQVMVMSDGLLLGAALRNLLSNAIKYTQPGGRILVGCRRCGPYLRIEVHDTGIGIASEQIPRIFDAFTRLDPVQNDGLGIGLFIVRQALGLLGHRIYAASRPSVGSLFSILAARFDSST
ncbi:sensor histidine kinase KdpD [Bradyrhizobium liaoningense]|uniref:sensor histidine kinase n=1 Tax=Bradyrhizobium liaoningense TaxID=43992 RepID=UPI001BA91493|nr:HAMP domain-containing sensor histidine kinase [Bradyrhizobium liaoningense]MBR0907837.1 HAMP domain-containing histidine kinase [Bradyrhizobium liaoningense]